MRIQISSMGVCFILLRFHTNNFKTCSFSSRQSYSRDTIDMYRECYVNTMIAYALAPHNRQVISNQHVDQHCAIYISRYRHSTDYALESSGIGNPLISLLLYGSFSQGDTALTLGSRFGFCVVSERIQASRCIADRPLAVLAGLAKPDPVTRSGKKKTLGVDI